MIAQTQKLSEIEDFDSNQYFAPDEIMQNPRYMNRGKMSHLNNDMNCGYGLSPRHQQSAQFALTNSQTNGFNDMMKSQGMLTTSQYTAKNKEDDTITQSSQILSERTLNLKKEINKLDDEIIQLQTSL